jgi:hypothetical protein
MPVGERGLEFRVERGVACDEGRGRGRGAPGEQSRIGGRDDGWVAREGEVVIVREVDALVVGGTWQSTPKKTKGIALEKGSAEASEEASAHECLSADAGMNEERKMKNEKECKNTGSVKVGIASVVLVAAG